jgi:excisionase family DNA binding protein
MRSSATDKTRNGHPATSTPAAAKAPDGLPQLLTVVEVAATLKVSERTLYRWIKWGELPVRRLGRSIRIDRKELDRFVAAH